MSKYLRDKRGRFRSNLTDAFTAGWDSVKNGADLVNCHFRWFLSRYSMEQWSAGARLAKEYPADRINEPNPTP